MTDRVLVEARLRERARRLARSEEHERPGVEHLLVSVAGVRLAVPLTALRQTVAPGPVTGLPGLPAELSGVRPLRGEIVCLADTAALLGGQAAHEPGGQHVVVLEGDRPLGLLVDEVQDLIHLESSELHPAPPAATEFAVLAGVTSAGVLVLDAPAVLADPRLDLSASPSSEGHHP